MSIATWWQGLVSAVFARSGAGHDLRAFVGRFVAAHRVEAQGARIELEQLQVLLADTAARLHSDFNAICALSSSRQDGPGGLASPPAGVPQACEATAAHAVDEMDEQKRIRDADDMSSIHTEIERAVDGVVVTLQFQDIASQLVQHATARIAQLERIAGQLDLLPHARPCELVAGLEAMLAGNRQNPITQTRMVRGTDELFQDA